MGEDVFQGLQLRNKQLICLKAVHSHCSFVGKRVLEIGSEAKLQAAQAMLRLGAKEVVAVNPGFRKETLEMGIPGITPVATPAENLDYPDGYFDIIFGVALLEHVHHPKSLAEKCSKLLDKEHGFCFLQGNPVWTSAQGHHIICHLGDQYIHPDNIPPLLENWQHLCMRTHEEAISVFQQRGFSHDDAVFLSNKLLNDPHISRITPTKIINSFVDLPGITTISRRNSCKKHATEWFNKALSMYSKTDLDTLEIKIMMWHTRPTLKELKESLSCYYHVVYR